MNNIRKLKIKNKMVNNDKYVTTQVNYTLPKANKQKKKKRKPINKKKILKSKFLKRFNMAFYQYIDLWSKFSPNVK